MTIKEGKNDGNPLTTFIVVEYEITSMIDKNVFVIVVVVVVDFLEDMVVIPFFNLFVNYTQNLYDFTL